MNYLRLCCMTGISDEQRADFRFMSEVAKTTRTAPPNRIEALKRFSARMKNAPGVTETLQKWGLAFGDIQKFNARTLLPEKLISGDGRGKNKETSYGEDNAEWNSMFRGYALYGPVSCQKWAVVYSQRKLHNGPSINYVVKSLNFLIVCLSLLTTFYML